MYDFKNLPSYGTIRVYATANRITEESAEHGDYAETGWVRRIGTKDIYESRNDVEPVWELRTDADGNPTAFGSQYVDLDDAMGDLKSIIGELDLYETEDGSTLYSVETDQDLHTGDEYSYALHAHIKHRDMSRGYVEDDVSIV